MKIELFLEKIRNIKEVESIEKTKFGYEVKLKEGYVFAELNVNERTFSNQGIVEEYIKEVVKRTAEEVVKYGKIKSLEYKIEREKNWCNYYLKNKENSEKAIEKSKSEIENYKKWIKNCEEKIKRDENSLNHDIKELEEQNKRIQNLEKELEELQNS